MNDGKGTDIPQVIEQAGHKSWERMLLGENSIEGTFRILLYIAVFVAVFGLVFAFAG